MLVGFAKADVTPAIGKEVPGSLTKRYSTAIHDPLYATAAAFEHDGQRAALVGLDSLSVKASVVREARRIIKDKCGIPESHVMVGASHTHNGGPCMGALPGDFSQASDPELCEKLAQDYSTAGDADYQKELANQIATAVICADQRKQQAVAYVGRGHEASVVHNRRFIMKDGKQITHPGKGNPDIVGPAGPVDPEVGVLAAWSTAGEFLGVVVNYALHGTVFGGGTSADWPHYMRQLVTDALDPDAHVVFLNGACGDVTQVDNLSMQESEFGEKWARRVGHRIGGEVIRVIADAEPGELAPIAAARETIMLKTREVSKERYEAALAAVRQMLSAGESPDGELVFQRDEVLLFERNRWEPEVECEVHAIQIGPAVYVSNPAEYFCQFGLNIKQQSHFPFTWVVELANGCVGYVPTPEALGENGGGYEPRLALSSKLVPEAGQMIQDASVELANSLTPGEVPPRPTVGNPGTPWGWGASSPNKT